MLGLIPALRSVRFHRAQERSRLALEARLPAFADYASRARENRERLGQAYRDYTSDVSTGPSAISEELAVFLLAYCEAARSKRVLDLGSGFSSFVFRSYQRDTPSVEVTSVDSDGAWLDKTCAYLARVGLSTDRLLGWDEFEAHPRGPYDLVLLDIRPIARRVEWLGRLFERVSPGGALVLDDVHKPHLRHPLLDQSRRLDGELLNLRAYTLDRHGRYAALLIKPGGAR